MADGGSRAITLRRVTVGVLCVFANYVNFLLFAQFGYLQRIQGLGFGPQQMQRLLGAMGATGIVTSLLVPVLLNRASPFAALRLGFLASMLVVFGAILSESPSILLLVSAGIGFSVGLTSVTLSALLRRLFPARTIGLHAGLATGLAYLVCNIPWLFEAPPAAKGIFACAALCVGLVSTFWLRCEMAPGAWGRSGLGWAGAGCAPKRQPDGPAAPAPAPLLSRPAGFAVTTGMFLALIWLDSAAFTIIQNTPHLKAASWGGPASQLRNGVVHLAAALAAGWAIDRQRLHGALILSYLIIAAGILLVERQGLPAAFAATFYVIAVSVYSTGLSAYPALDPEGRGSVPIRWRAGILYAVSGWLGSALGVGMAQTLRSVPGWFLAAAGAVMGSALVALIPRRHGPG